jgi:hypothetical protein
VQATRPSRGVDSQAIGVEVVDREEIEDELVMSPGNVAMLAKYRLDDAALRQFAVIVWGAETSRRDLTSQSTEPFAISLGFADKPCRRSRNAGAWHGRV